jgi:signal recognition particle subunit SRP54
MDSMSKDELDKNKPLTEPRMKAIARGSGTSMLEVHMLLEEFKNVQKMIKNLGGLNMGRGNELQNLMRNPNQIMQKLGGAMNPQMIQSLGGMENIMGMLKQFGTMEKNGQMPDLAKMMKAMGKK